MRIEQRQGVALFSVYDKTEAVDVARYLFNACEWSIWATPGTAEAFNGAGIPVTSTEIYGKPLPDHKVVSAFPQIMHGLSAPDTREGHAFLRSIGAAFIDAVFVDLYPLASTRQPRDIDVGGRSLLAEAGRSGRLAVVRKEWRPTMHWIKTGMPDYSEKQLELAAAAEFEIAMHAAAAGQAHLNKLAQLRRE